MSEQDLHDPQLNPVLQETRRIRMARRAGSARLRHDECGVTRLMMPASAFTSRKVRPSAERVVGPTPHWLGHSQRLSPWVFQSCRSSASTGAGKGTARSLLPLPMTRIRPFLPSMAVTSREAASLMRRPQAYISRKALRATGSRTRAINARASASERTSGRRFFFGERTLF